MAWSPLGGGRLFDNDDPQALRVREVLAGMGKCHGVSEATMAYAWILRHPSAPLPITGSGRIDGLREALAALDLRMSAEDWYAVWQASAGREIA
jgi:predicted oxidoreductase